jgi:hypothetical protein
MPTKKQRRRRAKNFRHEYDFVIEDDEGNEVPVESSELRAERNQRDKQRAEAKPAQKQSSRGGRATREPAAPSWQRAMRRGGIMGALMLLAFVFLFKSAPIEVRLGWGVFYAAAFVPLTYFIDRTAYRSHQKRLARTNEKKTEKKKAA